MIKSGQILNDTYEIIERLGSGAGGIIFKAYHRRMQKYVAIKLIKDDIKEKLNNRSEVDVLKNLKNDYLPQVLDFIEDGGEVYTVMEFIEGQNFKQIITGGRQFDEKSVRKYALQLCEAVEYLHGHQPPIIHSDIKPSNIMLTPQDKICLIDFNISMVSDNGVAVAAGGSRGFAAPEQFKRVISTPISVDEFHEETRFIDNDDTEILPDSEQTGSKSISGMRTKDTARAFIDIRTDIYGIGASVYYMLTSRIPVGGRLDFRGVRCSAQFREVIEKAMNPDPSKRYRNVTELKKALHSHISKKMLAVPAAAVCIAALSAAVISSGVFDRIAEMPANDTVTQTVSETVVADVTTVPTLSETITTTTEPTTTAESTATEEITTTATVAVPSLVGLTESEAIKVCESLDFKYEIYTAENDSVKKGIVSSQQIPADANVPQGMKIGFTVSTGKSVKMVTVPSVLNKSYIDAITALNNAGLQHKITYEDDSRVQKGYVFKQSHKSGSSVEENTAITIYVSTHEVTEEKTTVPAPEWSETAMSRTMYVTEDCYSREKALIGSTSISRYYVGESIEIIAITDTGYYKLANGEYIHSDYISDSKPDYITIKGNQYSVNLSELDLQNMNLDDSDIQSLRSMKNLQILWLNNNNITDLTPISELYDLTEIHLGHNSISDITPLKNLTNIEILGLKFNKIIDISPLSNLSKLYKVSLNYNQITDISPLKQLKQLKYLWLHNNNISDISSLEGLTNLDTLSLSNNNIENLNYLSNLTLLRFLYLGNMGISDLSFISGLTDLYGLDLSNNNITDISALGVLPKMANFLYLHGNKVKNIDTINNLTNLRLLSLNGNPIEDYTPAVSPKWLENLSLDFESAGETTVAYLKNSLPNCNITNETLEWAEE